MTASDVRVMMGSVATVVYVLPKVVVVASIDARELAGLVFALAWHATLWLWPYQVDGRTTWACDQCSRGLRVASRSTPRIPGPCSSAWRLVASTTTTSCSSAFGSLMVFLV